MATCITSTLCKQVKHFSWALNVMTLTRLHRYHSGILKEIIYSRSNNLKRSMCGNIFPGIERYDTVWPLHGMWLESTIRGMAGHSKWQNIRHTKSAKDAERQVVINKLLQKMKVAVTEGGGTDPKLNFHLARAMEEGKRKDVPNSTMDALLKRLEKAKQSGSKSILEGKGPGNCMLIIEVFTDNMKRTRQNVHSVFKKFGGRIGDNKTSMHAYDPKGVVYVDNKNELDLDAAMELAIEAGAEDVELKEEEEEEKNTLMFLSDPSEMHSVKKMLEGLNQEVTHVSLEYFPHTFATLSQVESELCEKLFDKLEELEEVIKIHDNIAVKES